MRWMECCMIVWASRFDAAFFDSSVRDSAECARDAVIFHDFRMFNLLYEPHIGAWFILGDELF